MTKPTKKPKVRRPSGTYKPGSKQKPWPTLKPWEKKLGADRPSKRAGGE